MKKKTLLLSVILMFGATMFFTSCKDKACRCEITWEDYDSYYDEYYKYSENETFDKYDMDKYRVRKCEELEREIEDDDEFDEPDEVKCEAR